MRAVSKVWVAGLLLVASSPAAKAQQRIDYRASLARDAYLRVYLETEGRVRIEGWDRDSVAFTGTADAGLPEFTFGGRESSAKGGLWDAEGTGGSAELEVRVPRGITLWVKTTGASVVVGDVTGGLDVYSVTGDVDVGGSPRQIYAESMGGAVTVDGTSRSVRAKTGSGPITLRGAGEDVTLTTVAGTIRVSGTRLRRGQFESVTGDISFEGALEPGSSLGFETHSGRVDLLLPPDAGAECTVTSIRGPLEVDFPVAGALERSGARGPEREFTIGDGSSSVRIQTFDGPVAIRRR